MQKNIPAVLTGQDIGIIEVTVFDAPKKYREGMFIQFIDDEIYPAVAETAEPYIITECIQVELTQEPSHIAILSQPLGEVVMFEMSITPTSGVISLINAKDYWKKTVGIADIGSAFGVTDDGSGKLRIVRAGKQQLGIIRGIESIGDAEYVTLEFLGARLAD